MVVSLPAVPRRFFAAVFLKYGWLPGLCELGEVAPYLFMGPHFFFANTVFNDQIDGT
jgi:hypothetical protein